jgi:hypothetical protein
MSEQAQRAYSLWRKRHIVNMQVHTDEQMFIIGFEEGQDMIKEMADLIYDMEKELQRLNAEIQKLKKRVPKNAKEV